MQILLDNYTLAQGFTELGRPKDPPWLPKCKNMSQKSWDRCGRCWL